MLNKVKIKILLISLLVILAALVTGKALAFYQTVGKAENVVTSGNIKLILHDETDASLKNGDGVISMLPGDAVAKKVYVENNGKNPFYLRVKPELSSEYGGSVKDIVKLDINTDCWEFHDGWYYYKAEVKPGEKTEPLFTEVELDGFKVDSDHLGISFSLTVVAHAVQSQHNALTDGAVYTASGWPAE